MPAVVTWHLSFIDYIGFFLIYQSIKTFSIAREPRTDESQTLTQADRMTLKYNVTHECERLCNRIPTCIYYYYYYYGW